MGTEHRHMKTRSWRKACFFKLNEIAVSNSHLIFQEWHDDFPWSRARERLAEELQQLTAALDGFAVTARRHRQLLGRGRLDLSLGHFPDRKARVRGYCVMHKPVGKRSNVFCTQCKVFLCPGACYKEYHTVERLPTL